MSQLEAMGFPTIRCQKALLATDNSDADTAMTWLFEHMEDPGKLLRGHMSAVKLMYRYRCADPRAQCHCRSAYWSFGRSNCHDC